MSPTAATCTAAHSDNPLNLPTKPTYAATVCCGYCDAVTLVDEYGDMDDDCGWEFREDPGICPDCLLNEEE